MHGTPEQANGVRIAANGVTLDADLAIPAGATGIAIFAHGSGSSRFSPRNRMVASELNRAGIATLLVDLLTPAEERVDRRTARLRFDIQLLTNRLVHVTDWVDAQPATAGLAVGYFGASTGAAAALIGAALRPLRVVAVVSRGGRPDLAAEALSRVRAATLLIVGGADPEVLSLNRGALQVIQADKRLEVVEGATHLFEEPGALEQVAALSTGWLRSHFPQPARRV
ncbi:MAG: hydrolase [Gemmatimonadota bacterium]